MYLIVPLLLGTMWFVGKHDGGQNLVMLPPPMAQANGNYIPGKWCGHFSVDAVFSLFSQLPLANMCLLQCRLHADHYQKKHSVHFLILVILYFSFNLCQHLFCLLQSSFPPLFIPFLPKLFQFSRPPNYSILSHQIPIVLISPFLYSLHSISVRMFLSFSSSLVGQISVSALTVNYLFFLSSTNRTCSSCVFFSSVLSKLLFSHLHPFS